MGKPLLTDEMRKRQKSFGQTIEDLVMNVP